MNYAVLVYVAPDSLRGLSSEDKRGRRAGRAPSQAAEVACADRDEGAGIKRRKTIATSVSLFQ